MRAEDEPITLKKKACRRQSVGHRKGRPVVEHFDSQISNVRETQRHNCENEQIKESPGATKRADSR